MGIFFRAVSEEVEHKLYVLHCNCILLSCKSYNTIIVAINGTQHWGLVEIYVGSECFINILFLRASGFLGEIMKNQFHASDRGFFKNKVHFLETYLKHCLKIYEALVNSNRCYFCIMVIEIYIKFQTETYN